MQHEYAKVGALCIMCVVRSYGCVQCRPSMLFAMTEICAFLPGSSRTRRTKLIVHCTYVSTSTAFGKSGMHLKATHPCRFNFAYARELCQNYTGVSTRPRDERTAPFSAPYLLLSLKYPRASTLVARGCFLGRCPPVKSYRGELSGHPV